MCDNSHLFGGALGGAARVSDGMLCIKNNILCEVDSWVPAPHFTTYRQHFSLNSGATPGYSLE